MPFSSLFTSPVMRSPFFITITSVFSRANAGDSIETATPNKAQLILALPIAGKSTRCPFHAHDADQIIQTHTIRFGRRPHTTALPQLEEALCPSPLKYIVSSCAPSLPLRTQELMTTRRLL